MAYVYSTLTNDQIYTLWRPAKEEGKPNVAIKKVQIKGGHGRMGKNLVTPLGVVTEVTDEELDALQKCTAFADHVKAGFIRVEKKKSEPEKVASTMEGKDASAQKTPSDFKDPPKVGKPEDDNG
jgi:hypothetical protein